MPSPPDDARSFRAEIRSAEPCGPDAVLLRVAPEIPIGTVRASRFFMLRREDGLSPAIPRPFSLYRREGEELVFLIQLVGRGTRALAASAPGTPLRCIGPLGNGWPPMDGAGPPWVLVAGGVGCAPFPLAIEQALRGAEGRAPVERAEELTYLFGAASAERLYDRERVAALGVRLLLATDDGSEGFHGTTVALLGSLLDRGELPERVRILACGPEPMLAAVSALAEARDLECWVSLETRMACGVGICNGCPVPTRSGGRFGGWPNAKCCVEGPVFSTGDVRVD